MKRYEVIERIALAIQVDMGLQLKAKRTPGLHPDAGDWTAEGTTLNLSSFADAALDAIDAAGFCVVPYEPTKVMVDAGMDAVRHTLLNKDSLRSGFIAMLDADKGEVDVQSD